MITKHLLHQLKNQVYLIRYTWFYVFFLSVMSSFCQPYINNWPTQGGFFYHFNGGQFNVLEGVSKLTEYSSTTALSDSSGELILYTDGVYLYDKKGKVSQQKLLPDVYQSDQSQIIPHPLKRDSYWLILNERNKTNFALEADDIFRIEVTKTNDGNWKIGQTDTFPRLGVYYGQQTLYDAETNCYTTVAYDPNFVLFSFKYCGCGGFEVFTDTLSDSTAEFYNQSWFPQVLRFSSDQKKVFLEAPLFANIPEFMMTGDYDMETGKVTNRKTVYKVNMEQELNDVRDAVFSPNSNYVYFTANGELNVYRFEVASGAVIKLTDPPNRDKFFDNFYNLELGGDGAVYIADYGSSVKTVLDVWRIPNPNSENAYIELAYRNIDYITYPKPPKGKTFTGILPDFPPFLYDKNYRFPKPLEIAKPQLELSGNLCFKSPTTIKNLAKNKVDSTKWQLWHNNNLLQKFTGNEVELEGLQSGEYTMTATNYGQCVDGETTSITFELDSLPKITLSEDTVFLCSQLSNQQEVHVTQNTQQSPLWNNGQQGESIIFEEPGEFVATVTNNCGSASDYISSKK